MYKSFFILLFVTVLLGCEQTEAPKQETTSPVAETINLDRYPEALQKVFAKHGSLERWNEMNALYFEIEKEEGNEKTSVDLKDRRERIETTDFITGYDGKDFWIEADTSYKGNPVFYHNLMFYFYAMPFVVSDPGINYGETEPVLYEGKSYPGIRISYNDGVGVSSKDEYFIHYDPQTFEMAWLGYTVTYYSNQKSDKLGWIRYDDWKKFNGVLLPNSATWFKTTEDGKLQEPRRTRKFVNVLLEEKPFDDKVFEKTTGAKVYED
ncbi:MAG: DUF6503 family protein [Saprospiraceae bacterium]